MQKSSVPYIMASLLFLASTIPAQSVQKFGLSDAVPQQEVLNAALYCVAQGYVQGAGSGTPRGGLAVRYIDGVSQLDVMGSVVPIKDVLQAKADEKSPKWIIPVFVNNKLLATYVVVKNDGKPFECVSGSPRDEFAYALEEITQQWVNVKGFHPVIVEFDYKMNRKFLYIPELQYDNLTYITFYPGAFVDKRSTAKKSKFMKFCIANGLLGSGSTDDVRRVYQAWGKNYSKDREESSLRKSTTLEPSEFDNVSKFEDTKAWWKTLNLPGT